MAVEIVMPRLGWTMEQGTLVEWVKEDGEEVASGDIVMLVESDKAVNEVEIFDDGILRIPSGSPQPGSTVPVGTLLAWVVQEGEEIPERASSATAIPSPAHRQPTNATTAPSDPVVATASAFPAPALPAPATRPLVRMGAGGAREQAISPRARRIALELGVDWRVISGSGRTGRIIEQDVRRVAGRVAERVTEAPPASSVTAARTGAQTASLTVEADATEFIRLQKKLAGSPLNDASASRTDLLIKLTAVALAQHHEVRADRQCGRAAVHVSRGVETGAGVGYGVIRDVASKSLREIARESSLLEERAGHGEPLEEDCDCSIAVVDMGPYGADSFRPALGQSRLAALGAGAAVTRPGVIQNRMEPRQFVSLSLTFDVDQLDEIAASNFLSTVRDYIQEPFQWLSW